MGQPNTPNVFRWGLGVRILNNCDFTANKGTSWRESWQVI